MIYEPPRPGLILGQYELIRRIGAGGMAEVFLARQEGPERFARQVAIKFVRPDDDDPEQLRSLIDEARVAAALSHPNIVQVIELDRYGDGFYLVMQYLSGWPLNRLARLAETHDRPPSLDALVDLGVQLLDALGYAHNARGLDGAPLRVVHRDVKPSNVMVDGRGHLKLVDFGIARAESLERRTATGMGKGTPAYMAPEQLSGDEVSPATDLFATGVLLCELAIGQRLFTADNFLALIHRRTEGFTADDRERLAAAVPELAEVVTKALAQNPAERWESAEAMSDALRALSSAPSRRPLRTWMTAVLGADPEELLNNAAVGESPTRVASGKGFMPSEVEGTREVASNWIEPLGTTMPLAGGEPGSTPSEVPPTRLVPRPQQQGRAGLMLALGVVLAAVVVLALRPWASVPDGSGPSNPDQILTAVVEVTPPTPTPEATPSGESAAETDLSMTPTPTEAPPDPTPAHPRDPPTPEATPEPVTAEAVAEATPTEPATEAADPGMAKGVLTVGLLGSGGTVEVGDYRRPAPTREMRLPPGVHTLHIDDNHGDRMLSVQVEVRSGETSRCVWKRTDTGVLSRLPDPEGAPCRVQ